VGFVVDEVALGQISFPSISVAPKQKAIPLQVWTGLDRSGQVWTGLDRPGQAHTASDIKMNIQEVGCGVWTGSS
jgi:hypothetical protein